MSRGHGGTMHGVVGWMVGLSAGLLLAGCHHRQLPPTLPPVLKAPDKQPPVPDPPPMQSKPPDTIATAPPVKVVQAKPKRAPKKSVPKAPAAEPAPPASPPPVDTAAVAPTAEGSIGALSAGGDAAPKAQQAAEEIIVASEKRLNELPQGATAQQAQLRNVRHFLSQAKEALGTGDAEGAMTLATKAKLLLDDLVKESE